jgi:hypothetical protein
MASGSGKPNLLEAAVSWASEAPGKRASLLSGALFASHASMRFYVVSMLSVFIAPYDHVRIVLRGKEWRALR